MPEPEIISRARGHEKAVAFRSGTEEHRYAELLTRSAFVASELLNATDDLQETRVAMLVPAGFEYATAQWAIWRAGGVAVPLCLSATESEWNYALSDSAATIVVTVSALHDRIAPLAQGLHLRLLVLEEMSDHGNRTFPDVTADRRAMILYTSGTTSKPKGVVTTHANINAQIDALIQAWDWCSTDRIPLFLPLHHVHGIINVMSCALWSGATLEPFNGFDLPAILKRVQADAYTVFMAVPTIYVKLIQAIAATAENERAKITTAFGRMRLMVSGSAALPASVHEQWTELTGQRLLERYGMTEIGMALSNSYAGERRPGSVGHPLPAVEIRLKAESGDVLTNENEPGEIQVRGPAVFHEYWNRPDITSESFDSGWFRTGDMAVLERGYYRIMGRLSVDIIKSGGYKLSALEIEAELLEHLAITECAVVGAPDETWGEAVAAVVVLAPDATLDLATLRDWCRDRLSVYKIPKRLLTLDSLPRNAMGKIQKPAILELLKS